MSMSSVQLSPNEIYAELMWRAVLSVCGMELCKIFDVAFAAHVSWSSKLNHDNFVALLAG